MEETETELDEFKFKLKEANEQLEEKCKELEAFLDSSSVSEEKNNEELEKKYQETQGELDSALREKLDLERQLEKTEGERAAVKFDKDLFESKVLEQQVDLELTSRARDSFQTELDACLLYTSPSPRD